MDYGAITERYYDKWLGAEGLFGSGCGVDFVYSAERNVRQYGYPRAFDIFALVRPKRTVVSYGDGAADRIGALRDVMGSRCDADEIKGAIETVYGVKAAHSVKFVYRGVPAAATAARALAAEDETAYVRFFAAAHPGAQTDWIHEYFDEMVREGTTFGVFADERLVSCADAPGMPYMTDEVQEIGIATLPEYRRCGYALDACVTAARTHVNNGKCPLWSAACDNLASHRLAEKVGFEKYADAIMISLE